MQGCLLNQTVGSLAQYIFYPPLDATLNNHLLGTLHFLDLCQALTFFLLAEYHKKNHSQQKAQ